MPIIIYCHVQSINVLHFKEFQTRHSIQNKIPKIKINILIQVIYIYIFLTKENAILNIVQFI